MNFYDISVLAMYAAYCVWNALVPRETKMLELARKLRLREK